MISDGTYVYNGPTVSFDGLLRNEPGVEAKKRDGQEFAIGHVPYLSIRQFPQFNTAGIVKLDELAVRL